MVLNIAKKLYQKAPESVRTLVDLVPIEYRLGGSNFTHTYEFLSQSEYWTREKLEEYQNRQLSAILNHACDTVPYYNNINCHYESPVENLKEFPIVDKKTIRENYEQFSSNNVNNLNSHRVNTGGTSGEPFSFIIDDNVYGKEWAFIMHGWGRVGYEPGDQLISFNSANFNKANQGKFWIYNPAYNTYNFSPYHLTPKNIPAYLNKIQEIQPAFIHGYPSAITKLARFVDDQQHHSISVSAVLAASENVYDHQRKVIEEAFDTRVFSHYGLSEKVVLAAECEHSTEYHLFPQYGFTEILDDEGNEVDPGETGEIVATGFLNKSMPFIRYRTGDYGIKGEIGCSSCGRKYRTLVDVKGRDEKERVIYIDESNKVAIHSIYYAMHGDSLDNIHSIQFHQKRPGEITVRIVPQSSPDAVHVDAIHQAFKTRLGPDFDIDVEFTDSSQLTSSGKKKLLIQDYSE